MAETPGHWNYRSRIRSMKGMREATTFEIELSILRKWEKLQRATDRRWSWFKDLGTSKWHHRLACILAWSEACEWNPWMQLIIQEADRSNYGSGSKSLMNVIGSQNSNKSFGASRLMVQLFIEDPDYTGVYVASPYKEATTIGIWGYIKEAIKEVSPHMGWDADRIIKDSKAEVVIQDGDRAGWIRVVAVDKVGMLQGKKPRSSERGGLHLLIEESGAFDKTPAMAVWDVLQNLFGQERFKAWSTCNFKSIFGLDGLLCKPVGKNYEDLDVDIDQTWDSVRNGFTIRLDGHKSPNAGLKKKKYPYLVGDNDITNMVHAGHGPKSPKYLEQIRSFPVTGMSQQTVTTMSKLQAGRVFNDEMYIPHRTQRWAFADPGLGGDAYILATAYTKQMTGGKIVLVPEPLITVPIDHGRMVEHDDIVHLDAWNRDHGLKIGDVYTPELQGATGAAVILKTRGIPGQNFGYDSSMRATVTRAHDLFIGSQALSMDYIGHAPQTQMPSGIGQADKLYANFITYLWFLAADMLENGVVREGDVWHEAFVQLTSRLWEPAGQRKKMENKADYKQRNANQSPDEADAVVGLLYIYFMRSGNFATGTATPEGSDVAAMILKRMRGLGTAKNQTGLSGRESIGHQQSSRRKPLGAK